VNRTLISLSLPALLLIALGCSKSTYVELKGTAGLSFEGSIVEDSSTRTVEGTVPDEWEVDDDIVYVIATFAKKQEDGLIRAQIVTRGWFGSHFHDEEATEASYGYVIVTYHR
jgi:hypothetical protein